MRPDEDVDLARGGAREGLFLFGGRDEPRELRDADGKFREALGKRVEMLLGENGRRGEERDLLARP